MSSTLLRDNEKPVWRIAMWCAITGLLLLPLIAMHFTRTVNWTGSDFLVAALLLGGGGMVIEIAARTVRSPQRRMMIGAATLILVALLWAQGAVGIV